jgi:hypothetical protein
MRQRAVLVILLLATLVAPGRATTLTPLGCVVDADCADGDACTTDVCDQALCRHDGEPGCGVPAPAEACGNCADDDGDGLIDDDDPDCCPSPATLGVGRLAIRDQTMHLALRHPLPAVADDTSLQIVDGAGTAVCATLGAGRWSARRGGRLLRVDDVRGRTADGVRGARLAPGTFRTTLHALRLAALVPGALRVTLRIGGACAQTTTTLRPRRRLLIAP